MSHEDRRDVFLVFAIAASRFELRAELVEVLGHERDRPSPGFASYYTVRRGNIGMPYESHDIGGHNYAGDASNRLPADLYVRWVQLGTFQPAGGPVVQLWPYQLRSPRQ